MSRHSADSREIQREVGTRARGNGHGAGRGAGRGAVLGAAATRESAIGNGQTNTPAHPLFLPTTTGVTATVVAVWSPRGSHGKTSLLVNLSAALAELGQRVILIDADIAGASVAQFFGKQDEPPGLPAACRAVAENRLDEAAMARALHPVGRRSDHFAILGASAPQRWREISPSRLLEVVARSRALTDWVLIDLASGWPSDQGLSLADYHPQLLSHELMPRADILLQVVAADPLSLGRLLVEQPLLKNRLPERRSLLVVNRVRAGSVGAKPERQIADSLARLAQLRCDAFVPDEPASHDQALLRGEPAFYWKRGALQQSYLSLARALLALRQFAL